MERRFACLGGLHDVLDGQATLHEDAARRVDRPGPGRRNLVGHDLHDRDTHREDVPPGEPGPGVQRLGRDVARRAARHAILLGRHRTGDAKVDEDYLGVVEVGCLQHDVGFLDVAMHHGLLMHEGNAVQTLSEDALEPLLRRSHALGLCTRLQRHQVAPVVRLAHHVVELGVLEKLEDLCDPLTAQLLQRLELLLEFLEGGGTHLRPLQALDAHLHALPARGQLGYALAAAPELLDHRVAGLLQSLDRHVNMGVLEAQLLAVLPELELDELVGLVDVQRAVAVEVEADVRADEVAERLRGDPDHPREQRPKLLKPGEADAVHPTVDFAKALHNGFLQDVPVLQEVRDGLDAHAGLRYDAHKGCPVWLHLPLHWWLRSGILVLHLLRCAPHLEGLATLLPSTGWGSLAVGGEARNLLMLLLPWGRSCTDLPRLQHYTR
mmetsp:Transcript_71856/g.227017  ORF Transcript_71856/g.227017 Transcript_71856/m.227017 type:complete len:437 (-) Transcript_71856:118-1428(-)